MAAATGSVTRPHVELPIHADQVVELAKARRRLRRNGVVIILVLDALIVGVGVAGAADLRSMRTPAGSAAAWADAAATGDCDRYLDLETIARRTVELASVRTAATVRRVSPRTQLCTEVADGWAGFSTRRAAEITRRGNQAVVMLTVTTGIARTDGTLPPPVTGTLRLRRIGGRWQVDMAAPPCPEQALTPALALCRAAS